ncbi:MAG: hypothetical protein AAFV19_13375 [Pseudomonadota bacterium]
MTIGIAAFGSNAGRAVLAALSAVEAVGTGAIGGFVSAVGLADGRVLRAETQDGGTAALRFAPSGPDFETTTMAALISSGPNRPEPLSAFALAEPGVGIVTGHRLPNAVGQDGVPMNRKVLHLMRAGIPACAAIEKVIAANPGADCGLAAIDANGNGFALQTVAAVRPDSHLLCRAEGKATVCMLHNAIQPHKPLAALAIEVALNVIQPELRPTAHIVLARGCPVRTGDEPALTIGEDRTVREIRVPNASTLGEQVLNLGYRPVVLGSGDLREVLAYEPFVVANDGLVVSVDGAESMQIATGEAA